MSKEINIMRAVEYTLKEFDKILKFNNYTIDRYNGDHRIYTNGDSTIAVPTGHKSLNKLITRRLIKENKLDVLM